MAAQAYDIARGRTVLFGGSSAPTSGLFGDTWEHNGSRWIPVVTLNAPSPRLSAGMAYDLARARIVLFGGFTTVDTADMWEFDGTNWTQRFPATLPSPRSNPGMAYDIARARTVLYGGFHNGRLADTWEFDGVNWVAQVTATSPSPNYGPISYDFVRARMVLLPFSGDTWTYDGQDWSRTPTVHRPPLSDFGQCYDPVSNVTLVLGGVDNVGGYSNDVWQFDGIDWSRTTATNGPSGRWQSVSATLNGRVLAFGGEMAGSHVCNDTWEWSLGTWRTLFRAPSPRQTAAMVYDPLRERMVLAGGNSGPGPFDTWERVDSTWTEIATASRPASRAGHAMIYDAAHGRIMLFGGAMGSPYGDTWFCDGVNWSQVNPTTSPTPRFNHAMAYDPVRRRVLLFGGAISSSQYQLSDTWVFDGTNWSQLAPTLSPPGREQHALAYDARRGVVVMFGGANGFLSNNTFFLFNDTWEFNGQNWSQRTGGPTARVGHAMTYDPQAGRVLLIGGYGPTPSVALNDSWQYDGVSWVHQSPIVGPPPGGPHGLAIDVTRGRIVAYDPTVGETWDYVPASVATATRYGIGCANGCGVPTLDAAPGSVPALGTQFTLRINSLCAQPTAGALAFGFDLAQWNGAALPVDVAPIGLPGCNLWIAPDAGWLFPLALQASVATFTVQVPADPQLAGLVAGAQAGTLDSIGTGALTNAVVMRVF